MPVSQSRLLFLSLLMTGSLFSTSIFADTVVVNTINDENNIDNKSCSIREAVNYLTAKIAKKTVIDEDIAIISGTSSIVATQLTNAQTALAAEKAKSSPDTTEIARLEKEISDLSIIINNGLLALNVQLNQTTDELTKEKNKATPDNNLIASYEATITSLKEKIKAKEAERTDKETELRTFRNTGLNGCISFDSNESDTISLFANLGTYLVDAPITLPFSVVFSLFGVDSSSTGLDVINLEDTSNPNAQPHTIIKAVGNHNLFVIDNGINNDHDNNSSTINQYITVSFSNIDFLGCDNNCAVNGGIFLNKEFLTITNSVISKGVASDKGGAIYNTENSVLSLKNTVIKANRANSGAAIFLEDANFSLSNSLLTENEATNISNGVITLNKTVANSPYAPINPIVENSTLSGNKGTALSLKQGVFVNNTTIVKNTVGIDYNSGLPTVYNSIIADNTTDCQAFTSIPADNKTYFANNLSVTNKGCPTVNTQNTIFISNTGSETLMAGVDSQGRCSAPPANGLLCPLANNGGLTRTHKPRLLASYTKLSDSPIINKGFNINSTSIGLACSNSDQRGKTRENNEDICDIGSFELIAGLNSSKQGDDITYGQTKRFSPLEHLGDAELLPAELCPSILGTTNQTYLNGCIRLIDLPRRGEVTFDAQTGELLYKTTQSDFHGFDTFSYSVITTLSRFNDAANDQALTTTVRVVSEPAESLPSKALDNGANNLFSLFVLGFIAFCRRIIKG